MAAPGEYARAPSVDGTPPTETPAPARRPAALAAARDGLTADELLAVLARVFPADRPVCHWLGGTEACGALAVGLPASLSGWREGRAWSARAEVRWEAQTDERYHVLYLGEEGAAPPELAPLLTGLQAEEGAPLRLWGRQGADGRYYAARLPRGLDYAGVSIVDGVAALPSRRLVDADGCVRFVRLALAEQAP